MDFKEAYEKCKKLDPKIWIGLYVIVSIGLLYYYPPSQVSHFEISNATAAATLENQYRMTLAQILGGGAVAIGIYSAWKNIEVAKEGQITERFTRAIDQLGAIDKLGNPALEIRLGGIYALKRIADESEKDHWPIMEILTAYVRKNSPRYDENTNLEDVKTRNTITFDIQAILTVIGKRKNYSKDLDDLDLQRTYLQGAKLQDSILNRVLLNDAILTYANLKGAHLTDANLIGAHLTDANLEKANLQGAYIRIAHLDKANLSDAHLEGAHLFGANLKGANLSNAHLEGAQLIVADFGIHETIISKRSHFTRTNLKGADLEGANLTKANLEGANLEGAKNLTIDQLSEVKTLYNVRNLDERLKTSLNEKYSALFKKPNDEI